MNITLRFFAGLRERLGRSEEALQLPPNLRTVGEVRGFLSARGGVWGALGEDSSLRMACNQVMCGADTPLTEACEVAFFPPVTGG